MLKYNDKGMKKYTRNELLKIYSKNLRDLTTQFKKDVMLSFIKEKIELNKIKDFIDNTDNTSKYIIDLNKVDNLDFNIYKEQFELEQIFLYSILYTEDFKKYVLNYMDKKVEV